MPSPREQVKHQSIKRSWNISSCFSQQLVIGGTALIAAAVGGYFYSKRWVDVFLTVYIGSLKSLGKDFDFTKADVQEGRRPCAWAHWGWLTQWLEGGWGQGQLEVGQLRGWQFQGWQLQDWQLRGQIEILIWHSSVTPFHYERLRKCVHRLWSEINTCFTLHFWLFDTFDMGGEWTRRPGIKGCHCIGCLSPKLNPINHPDKQSKWHIVIVFGPMHTSDTVTRYLCSWTGDTLTRMCSENLHIFLNQ